MKHTSNHAFVDGSLPSNPLSRTLAFKQWLRDEDDRLMSFCRVVRDQEQADKTALAQRAVWWVNGS